MNWQFVKETFLLCLAGIPITLQITFTALIVGTPIGLFFAFIKMGPHPIAKKFINLYISLIRGTPMVVQILIIYSLIPSVLNRLVEANQWNISVFDINPIYYANIIFTFTAVASLTEIYRSAILSIEKSQLEAALASGLSVSAAYRRIILPQALRAALPNLCNLTIQLVKGTSLAFIMTLQDITAIGRIQASYGYNYIEAYLDVFIIYIFICSIIQIVFTLLEKFFARHENRLIYKKGIAL